MSIAGGPFSATRCSPRWFRRAVGAGWLGLVVAALVSIIVGLLGVVPASAAARVSTYGTVGYTYDAPALLSSPDTAAAYVRGAPPGPEVGSWVSPTSVVGCCVAANTADDVGGMIYRTGSRTDNALTDASGVSFRDSVSSSLSSQHPQIFRPGDKVWAVDTSRLPPGAVVRDGVPPGHVSVNATPGQIRDAIVDDPFLGGLGLKPLDELGSYRLPR